MCICIHIYIAPCRRLSERKGYQGRKDAGEKAAISGKFACGTLEKQQAWLLPSQNSVAGCRPSCLISLFYCDKPGARAQPAGQLEGRLKEARMWGWRRVFLRLYPVEVLLCPQRPELWSSSVPSPHHPPHNLYGTCEPIPSPTPAGSYPSCWWPPALGCDLREAS